MWIGGAARWSEARWADPGCAAVGGRCAGRRSGELARDDRLDGGRGAADPAARVAADGTIDLYEPTCESK